MPSPVRSDEILAVCRKADPYCSESKVPGWVSSDRRNWIHIKSSKGIWSIRHNRRLILLHNGTDMELGWQEFDVLDSDWQIDLYNALKGKTK